MREDTVRHEPTRAARALSGGGAMGALIQTHPWERTELGPLSSWPQSLLTALSICLASRFPMVLWWGRGLNLLYNDAYSLLIGAKHPGSLGRKGREVWPELWDTFEPMFRGVMERGEASWSEDTLLLPDRKGFIEECYFTFSYSPVYVESGDIGGVFTAVSETTGKVIGQRRLRLLRELSDRTAGARSAEEACALAADVLARFPDDVPFARLYLADPERRRARLLGRARQDTAAGPESGSIALDSAAEDDPWHVARVVGSGHASLVEVPARAWVLPIGQEGTAGALVAGISPRLGLDADYRAFFELLATQVTNGIAKARAYEEERLRAEKLAELDRAKTNFFSNVSHEFRTPLTLMLGPLEELLSRAGSVGLSASDLERLDMVHRNAQRLRKLVNALLDFSRIEAGRMKARFHPTELSALTADLASVFRSTLERAGLTLSVDTPPLGAPVYVDREMWEKVVLNLLSNAFKFTLRGGIHLALTRDGERVRLTVRDTGTGIPSAELPHLFERFYRVEGAWSRTHEGSGIGLALIHELVKLHGGTLGVRSTVGEGSEFTVELPLGSAHLAADQVSQVEPPPPSAGLGAAFVEEAERWLPDEPVASVGRPLGRVRVSGQQRARILLADDNADMRAYVQGLLSETWEVEAVPDGESALRSALARPPDLVLTDVMMPRLDGFGLIQALRAEAATRLVPVILLSARAGEEARIEGLGSGADDYLIKPFSARELLARVSAHLATSRVRQETQAQLASLLGREQDARQKLEKLADDLQEAIYARDEFLSIASHELRTPITSLKLQLQRIQRRLGPNLPQEPSAGKVAEMVDSSTRQLDRLTRLIDDLLDVTRSRAGKLQFTFEDVRVDALLTEVLERFSDQLEQARCGLEVHLGPPTVAHWDRSRMEQVLVNLLSNAIKYAPGRPVHVSADVEGTRARLTVRDFGPGIPRERQGRIFERFERATNARDISGLGLGLFIASEIVRGHQGALRVESEPGQGAAFIVELPLSPQPA
ncbi:ATP-binding protein [Myxococcaceae bacterium GXIMD 01537]